MFRPSKTMTADSQKKPLQLYQYLLLMRLDRPIGMFLLLWPTLWALWIAGEGKPDMHVLLVFVLGVFLMRSAGCVINDYADRNFDPHVERTRNRPLVTGRVTSQEALTLFVVLSVISFLLVLTLNSLTIMLSLAGVLLAVIYPYMKRYTYLPQIFLGMAFGWAVPMAFAAETGTVPNVAWLLFIVTVLWATAYDTMYAMVDRLDDMRIGVKSTAILFGDADRIIIAIFQLLIFVVLVIIGKQLALGGYYYLGVTTAVFLAIYQQYLIKDRLGPRCFKAFHNNNWFGGAIFLGIVLDYMTR
jgi:4-hydroxybenzoate polyprenyltransferase